MARKGRQSLPLQGIQAYKFLIPRQPTGPLLLLLLAMMCALPDRVMGFQAAATGGRSWPRASPCVRELCGGAVSTRASMCDKPRRDFLRLGLGGAALGVQIVQPALVTGEEDDTDQAADDDASPRQQLPKLMSRFGNGQIKTLGPAGPLGPPEATVPAWLEGEWNVEYTFKKATFPLTKDFAQFKQLLAGSIRSPSEMPVSLPRPIKSAHCTKISFALCTCSYARRTDISH